MTGSAPLRDRYFTPWMPKDADNGTNLKDLVRFEIKFTAASAGQGVVYCFLPPTWYDTAPSLGNLVRRIRNQQMVYAAVAEARIVMGVAHAMA